MVDLLRGTPDGPAGEPARRERYRHVHVVMTRVDFFGRPRTSAAGVFLTEADAEDARAAIAAVAEECWIEVVPIAV
ncbi:hypothetical protein [Kitasatospora sp. NPDC101183]|uniref:hypothetical protein n=1 Tax=Kitasatospora sp. NPDC101183 TaxID=3364100 RepID=UPI0037FC4F68